MSSYYTAGRRPIGEVKPLTVSATAASDLEYHQAVSMEGLTPNSLLNISCELPTFSADTDDSDTVDEGPKHVVSCFADKPS